ncbi:MAG: hypothetical protein C5S48_01400 [Candidatus Methanogaster sp.]|nr:MAG: hypothetical protein C5S48_01400 [ANME-2 cluster archaeon]
MMYLPSAFVMPYMIGYTDDVEKPMFLRRWGAIVSDHRKQQNQDLCIQY